MRYGIVSVVQSVGVLLEDSGVLLVGEDERGSPIERRIGRVHEGR